MLTIACLKTSTGPLLCCITRPSSCTATSVPTYDTPGQYREDAHLAAPQRFDRIMAWHIIPLSGIRAARRAPVPRCCQARMGGHDHHTHRGNHGRKALTARTIGGITPSRALGGAPLLGLRARPALLCPGISEAPAPPRLPPRATLAQVAGRGGHMPQSGRAAHGRLVPAANSAARSRSPMEDDDGLPAR